MNEQEVFIQCKILLDVSKKKYKLLEEVLNITENQKEVIGQWGTGEDLFNQMVEEKQNKIAIINELDQRFQSIYTNIKTDIKNNLSEFRSIMKEIKTIIEEIMDLGIKIQVLEEINRNLLEGILTKPKQESKKFTQSPAKSITAYKNFSSNWKQEKSKERP